jgi:acetyltransferase-like isoleucine patch superfamily enzyme
MRKLCEKKFSSFGHNSEVRPGAYIVNCSKIRIGSNVVIRPGVFMFADAREGAGQILVDDDVLIGSSCHFYVANHEFFDNKRPIISQGYPDPKDSDTIHIERGAWVGANVVILKGVTIGANSVIGAGSVVTRSIPAGVIAAGNPAKIVRNI